MPKKVVLTCPDQEANETGPVPSSFSLRSGHGLGWSVQVEEEKEGRKEEEEEGGAASQNVGRRGEG